MSTFFYHFESPIGNLFIYEENNFITHVTLEKEFSHYEKKETALLKSAVLQLQEYFMKKRTQFELPLKPEGTLFQKKVWDALCRVPYGETKSYKEIAETIGNPQASRAIGLANNRNPVPIIIPCHRIVGSNQKLTGYAYGLDAKKYLLQLENPGYQVK